MVMTMVLGLMQIPSDHNKELDPIENFMSRYEIFVLQKWLGLAYNAYGLLANVP